MVYAGGTELLLVMKLGFAEYGHLVDVKGIPELRRLEAEDGALVIGGGVTHRTLERSALVREGWPALAAMERSVANVRVRGAGTLGGNLAFSDPHSDPATFLLAAEAEVELRLGRRAAHDAAARLRARPLRDRAGAGRAARRRARARRSRRAPPWPTASSPSTSGRPRRSPAWPGAPAARWSRPAWPWARSAWSRPARPKPRPRWWARPATPRRAGPGEAAAAACAPVEDANGSVEYKRQLVRVLVERAMREALARAA